jgi:putative endonuclease
LPPRPSKARSSIPAHEAEDLVVRALGAQGWRIVGRNFRHVGCELDVVAAKGGSLAIIEVKARPGAAVYAEQLERLLPESKRAALQRGAEQFLALRGLAPERIRFDLALVFRDACGNAQISYFAHVF